MNAKRILGGALVLAAFAASAAIAAPATSKKLGKFDVYADAARTGKFDTYSEGSKIGKYDFYSDGQRGKFDSYSEGTRQGKFDSYSEGSRVFSGEISASSLDNSRNGGDLYGYRV
jgi:hypothetical protein